MGNSVSLRVWSDNDDDVIVNSPFLSAATRRQQQRPAGQQGRRVPRIVTSHSSGSSSSSSTIALSLSTSTASTASSSTASASASTTGSSTVVTAEAPRVGVRQCWICYGEEEEVPVSEAALREEFESNWVSPCACKGTTKWVHQACLLDWIDSQLGRRLRRSAAAGDASADDADSTTTTATTADNEASSMLSDTLVIDDAKLACPQCHVLYRVDQAYALPRPILQIIDAIAAVKERLLIWGTLGMVSSALYTLSFTHGFWSGWMIAGDQFLDWIHSAYSPDGTALARLQVSTAVPLIPLYALSLNFPGLGTWLYPLTPLFTYAPQMQCISARGFLMVAPIGLLAARLIWRRSVDGWKRRNVGGVDRVSSVDSVSRANSSSISPTTVASTASISASTTASTITTTTTTASTPTLKISILSTTAALLSPTLCSLLGRLLCSATTATASLSAFQKSLVGAGVVVAVREALRLLYWYQTERLRRYRRVLNHRQRL